MKSNIFSRITSKILIAVLMLSCIAIVACTDGNNGLEYKVNSDGKTCTITELGTYSSKDLIIPSNIGDYKVTAIADCAFQGTDIETFSGSDNITEIGMGAFRNCKYLRTVLIPNGVIEIKGYCFEFCESLHTVNLPSNLASIGYAAFANCSSLANIEIPNTVLEIGEFVFKECNKLSSIKLPSNLQRINKGLFINCLSLVTVNIPETVVEIGAAAFSSCQRMTSINIPNKVELIGDFAFAGCQSLPKIVIPDSVTQIGQSAFALCLSLAEIYFPESVIKIGTSPLLYTNLTRIDVDIDNPILSSIDGNLYFNSTIFLNYAGGKLDSFFSMPDGVEQIGTEAFAGCINLQTLYVPKSVKYVGCQIFYLSPNIKTLYYDGTVEDWNKIEKEADWNKNTESVFTIICTDGTIAMDGTVTYN